MIDSSWKSTGIKSGWQIKKKILELCRQITFAVFNKIAFGKNSAGLVIEGKLTLRDMYCIIIL